ncbi:hypothetical protein VN12_04010 [Pirellula sp. SH-Sr6A]|uniref:hypothetical protein n=1 Tax=Pirellula sp. SH-Sr6A TaxID=1632865 RepID=UPI00078E9164|nr:hypothetical protein [Pirellula sp. SH-Sr6A]AMV31259.1 hypothetical protein VN12_04010 [Pirellula sp. SH-Sr6A]
MPELPILILLLTVALVVMWIVGEASNKPWLRRVAAPLLFIMVAGISAAATGISTSFDSSIRYSGAVKRFVSAVIRTAERDGDAAAIDQLRKFDSVSIETYEGGALLRWLAEPVELETSNP